MRKDISVFALLLPNSGDNVVELPYFIAFLVLLLGSFYLVLSYNPMQWDKRLRQLNPYGTQENYASIKEYVTTSFLDSLLNAMPGIFLIVGLSGTFLSLIIVLNNLKILPGIDEKSLSDSLNHTLSGLGSKFKISVWGILCNIVYRFFYYHSINKLDQKVKSKVKEITEAFVVLEGQSKNNVERFQAELLMKTASSAELLFSIDKEFKNFSSTVNTLGVTVTNFGRTVSDVATSLAATTTSFSGATRDFNIVVKDFGRQTSETLGAFTESTKTFDSNINASFTRFSDSVKTTLLSISKDLGKATSDSTWLINETLKELRPVVDKLNEQMENSQRTVVGVSAILEQLDDRIAASNEVTTTLARNIGGNNQTIAKMNLEIRRLIQVLEENLKNRNNEGTGI